MSKAHPFIEAKGECYFGEPFSLLLVKERWNKELPPLFERVKKAADDRSLAIFGAIVIEENIAALLKLWMPGFNNLHKQNDFTFSFKIKLLKSFKLIPSKIFAYANLIRDVRNRFAHDFELDNMGDLDDKLIKKVNDFHKEIDHFAGYQNPESLKDKFYHLTAFTTSGLRVYESNIRILRQEINKASFKESLNERANEETEKHIQKLL